VGPLEPVGDDLGEWEPITIIGVVEEGVGKPKNDGTRESALYRVPLRLSRRPPPGWATLFQQTWDRPPSFSTMHRLSIARVVGDTVVLDGTTIDELEEVHVRTLRLVLDKVNENYGHAFAAERDRKTRQEAWRREHDEHVRDVSKRLRSD
jgi:hypothetical protein